MVRLSGEHPTLPRAELAAVLAVHAPGATVTEIHSTAVQIAGADEAPLDRLSLAHEVADFWSDGDLDECVQAIANHASGNGSIAVRCSRDGAAGAWRQQDVERQIGTALVAAGHTVDLKAPEQTIVAWMHGDRMCVGLRSHETDRSRFERRHVTDRDHFSPVGMHPRRAAGLVHLARVPDGGALLDPFCGTGGIVMEAALAGLAAMGSDLDHWMVQGTLQALADAADQPLEGTVFQADIAAVPELLDTVDGIVTDLPYGRASTTDKEAVGDLYDRAFHAFAQLLPTGGRAVLGCADEALGRRVENHGFDIVEHHAEFVHRSMTRHYLVARRR